MVFDVNRCWFLSWMQLHQHLFRLRTHTCLTNEIPLDALRFAHEWLLRREYTGGLREPEAISMFGMPGVKEKCWDTWTLTCYSYDGHGHEEDEEEGEPNAFFPPQPPIISSHAKLL